MVRAPFEPWSPCHQGRQLAEIGQAAPQGLPRHPAQGAGLRHQQDQPALQGAPGL